MYQFSIVTPSCARAESLARLLQAVAGLDYSSDRFEVIVVDDGGPVPLDGIVAPYRERLHLRLLRQSHQGPGAARNLGAREAKGVYLAFTDDDCTPETSWLREMENALQKAPGAMCGGKTVNMHPESLPSQATQLLMEYLYENYNPTVRTGAFFPANNMAVPREKFLELGGFDEELHFGEDREFCSRWQSLGSSFVTAPDAVVQHGHRQDLRTFVRLHFLYGGGTSRFRSVSKQKGLKPAEYSSPLWYLGLVLSGLKRKPGWRGLTLSVLLAVSQTASLAGMAWAWLAYGAKRGSEDREIHQLRHRDR
jgi:GT2 family glycosyltransferase